MQTIGIVGTGELGWRVGKLLAGAGYRVVSYDVAEHAQCRAKDSGFSPALGVADLCRQSDFVLTCVTGGAELRDVVTSPGGIAETLPAGRPLIDTTSAEPWITKELAPILAAKGIPFLDAPVSGGKPAADSGRMNFMVGGDVKVLDRCRPVLKVLGPVVMHVGPVGTGHTLKAINMLALAPSMLATAELIALGLWRGVSMERLVDMLEAGNGASFSTRVHFPKFIAPGNYASGFSFNLMLKDLSIGIGLADRADVPLFLQRTCYEIYRAKRTGLAGEDNTRIVEEIISSTQIARPTIPEAETLERLETLAVACNAHIAAESISLGRAAGLQTETIIKVLAAGSGDSKALSKLIPRYLEGNADSPAISLKQVAAAAAAVLDDAMRATLPMPLTFQAIAAYMATSRRFGEQSDVCRIVDMVAAGQ